MMRDGAHGVVRNTRGRGAAHPGRVGEKGVETAVAALVGRECLARHRNSPPKKKKMEKLENVHRPDQRRCHRSERARSTEWRPLAESGGSNYRTCSGTRGIRSR